MPVAAGNPAARRATDGLLRQRCPLLPCDSGPRRRACAFGLGARRLDRQRRTESGLSDRRPGEVYAHARLFPPGGATSASGKGRTSVQLNGFRSVVWDAGCAHGRAQDLQSAPRFPRPAINRAIARHSPGVPTGPAAPRSQAWSGEPLNPWASQGAAKRPVGTWVNGYGCEWRRDLPLEGRRARG